MKLRLSASLPVILLGLGIVGFALVAGAWWSPDYVNQRPSHSVSHQARLLGQDMPPGVASVERQSNYAVNRILDGLVYLAVAQIIVATTALMFVDDPIFIGLRVLAALYGTVYAATHGLYIGALIAFIGFSCILLTSLLDWITTTRARDYTNAHSTA